MSHEIVYEKRFVRVGEKIIPLVLTGSSNCTEIHWVGCKPYERHERYWTSFFTRGSEVAFTEKELMARVNSFLPSPYGEHFKYRSKWVDDEGLLSFVRSGIKNAKTVEELRALSEYPDLVYLNCCVIANKYIDAEDVQKKADWRKTSWYKELECTVTTSDQLSSFIEQAQKRLIQKEPDDETLYITIRFPSDKAVPHRKKPRPKA